MREVLLREREAVLSAAGVCLEGAQAGRGGVLAVVGEAGLGKTSVLDWACREADAEMDIGFARGETIEEALAFGLAHQVLQALGVGDLVGLSVSGVVESSAPFYRVLSWLQARTGRPLLVVVDDLQWADEDSLRLLAFLARRLEGLPVALVVALRPWPSEAFETFRQLGQAGYCAVERVRPLSRGAAAAMLSQLARDAEISEETEERAWELCAGNPLLVEEVALAVARGERVPEARAGTGAAAGLARTLLLARFAGVGAPALQCARAASVLGTEFRLELAGEVAGVAEGQIEGVLDSLCRSGLVVEDRGGTRFAHPLFAEALYEDLAPPVRRRLHERAFRILAARDLEPEAAVHAVAAELAGDRDAFELLARVGRSALARGAVASAATLLAAAARVCGEGAPAQLAIALADALTSEGRVADALGVLEAPLVSGALDWRERYAALRVHGRALLLAGSVDASMGAHADAITLAVDYGAPTLALEPLMDQALTTWMLRGPGAAVEPAARVLAVAAGASGSSARRVSDRGEATWAKLAFQTGDARGLELALLIAERLGGRGPAPPIGPGELVFPGNTVDQVAEIAIMAERFVEAERACRAVQDAAERVGAASALCTSLCLSAQLLIRRGRLAEALGDLARATEVAELYPSVLAYLELFRAEALLWLGRLEDSERCCEAGERGLPGLWFDRLQLAHVRGVRMLWQGDARASQMFLEAEELTVAAGIREPCVICWAGSAIDAHLAFGHPEDALRVLDWLEECADALPCRWPRAAAHLGRAALCARDGDEETAIERYRAALLELEQIDRPLQRVEALLAYGRFLRRHGRIREARAPLGHAQQLAETLDAATLAEAARRELQLAGGRRRYRSADRDQLTDAERRVAELAAGGYTNAEIARQLHLSLSTIETHLRHIYHKLDIHSRREPPALAPSFDPRQTDQQPDRSSAPR